MENLEKNLIKIMDKGFYISNASAIVNEMILDLNEMIAEMPKGEKKMKLKNSINQLNFINCRTIDDAKEINDYLEDLDNYFHQSNKNEKLEAMN